ncbi:MAG: deoxyguanosinetriphosphate triphosphohydrolase, partial [Alphaproteobacteria bacterium]|nr:deoxyguanosinetriphosphate triphosphohydrolase [Alphaproteobacteria bacterium]
NGPLLGAGKDLGQLPRVIVDYSKVQDLELDTFASAEAQCAALADDIAYNNHDIDDGLRAGLFSIRDLADVPLVGPIFAQVEKDFPGIDPSRHIHEAVRRLIGEMVSDLLTESRRRIDAAGVTSVDDVRKLDHPVIGFSGEMTKREAGVKAFLFENMYRHDKLNEMTAMARRVVRELFGLYLETPAFLPTDWQRKLDGVDDQGVGQMVADYVAGMTDRFALDEHRRLSDSGQEPLSKTS